MCQALCQAWEYNREQNYLRFLLMGQIATKKKRVKLDTYEGCKNWRDLGQRMGKVGKVEL